MLLTVDTPGDDLSTAQVVSLTSGVTTELQENIGDGAYGSGDVDLFKVSLTAGQTIEADVDAMYLDDGSFNGYLDSHLRFFNAAGLELTNNGDGQSGNDSPSATSDSFLTYTVVTGGDYFVGVSAAGNEYYDPSYAGMGSGSTTGNYTLQLLLPGNTNSAPVANNDSYTAGKNSTLTVAAAGVLLNDTDADGDGLSATLQTGPTNGSLNYLNSDGAFEYVPNGGFLGTDSFNYLANDGTDDSGIATVTINVTNTSPTITANQTFSVAENVSNGTIVGTVTGNDANSDPLQNWTITAGNSAGVFSINASSGEITIADSSNLNYEATTSYDLTLTVSDGAATSAPVSIIVNVTDFDEFDVGAISDVDQTSNSIEEGSAIGSTVGITASAVDNDGTAGVTYSLDDDAAGRFVVNTTSGVVTTASTLDAASSTSHTIVVRATSTDTSFSTATFIISVTEQNDPIGGLTDANATANTVAEDAAIGTTVGITVSASDPNATDTISYGLDDDAGGLFSINAATGVVATSAALDAEAATSHVLIARATSSDGTFSTGNLTVNVTDVDEAAISILSDSNSSTNTVNTGLQAGSLVGITASASDADVTDSVTYSLDDDSNGNFAIDSNTGVVTTAAILGASPTSHTIAVQATSTDGSTSAATFLISVVHVNHPPAIPSGQSFDVTNDSTVGTTVGTVTATDDGNSLQNWNITAGNFGTAFAIDSQSGTISVADSATLPSQSTYNLTVSVADGVKTSSEVVQVNVSPPNPVIVVTAGHDTSDPNDGATTLREAISLANSQSGRDVIEFDLPDSANDRIQLSQSSLLTATSVIEIAGPIDGVAPTLTLADANPPSMRILTVSSAADVELSDLVIAGGNSPTDGGALWNAGTLRLNRVTVDGSMAAGMGGGVFNTASGQLTVEASTISSNVATAEGGGIYNAAGGTLSLSNTTISSNTSSLSGGGIYDAGSADIVNVTIASNVASSGSGVHASGSTTLTNTLVATNTGSADVVGSISSNGNNLVGDGSAATGLSATSNDQFGTASSPIDPLLGPLQHNGGATKTHQLLIDSPAIDAGSNAVSLSTDQRGAPRQLDGPDPTDLADSVSTTDIGAFEFGTLFVSTDQDGVDSTPLGDGAADNDLQVEGAQVTLRSAVQELNALANWDYENNVAQNKFDAVIMFQPMLGDVRLTNAGANEDLSIAGDLDIYGNLSIHGRSDETNPWRTVISGRQGNTALDFIGDRILHVHQGATLQLESLSVSGGKAIENGMVDSGIGGGILNDGGTLTLVNASVDDDFIGTVDPSLGGPHYGQFGNIADRLGGGIYSREGDVVIVGSRIEANDAVEGGGIYIESGSLTIDAGSVVINNQGTVGGGGIYLEGGELVVKGESSVAGNRLESRGAGVGIHVAGGSAVVDEASTITMNNQTHTSDPNTSWGGGAYNAASLIVRGGSRIEFNEDWLEGGGIYNTGTLVVEDAYIDNNTAYYTGGGALYNASSGVAHVSRTSIANNLSSEHGAGIFNNNGVVTLVDTNVVSNESVNTAGAGVYNFDLNARLTVINSTFQDNLGHGFGGGISNEHGTVEVFNSTFIGNDTTAGDGGTGGAIDHLGENRWLKSGDAALLELAASINSDQTTLFVTDLSPVRGMPLPFGLLVGDEPMLVTDVNDFTGSLIVERSTSSQHSVSTPVSAIVHHRQDRLRLNDTFSFAAYKMPLDVLIVSTVDTDDGTETLTEVVTVTEASDGFLVVERGRNGTKAINHQFPIEVWGISGSLTVDRSTFVGNRAGYRGSSGDSSPGGAIANAIDSFVRPTIIESSTFSANVAPIGATIATTISGPAIAHGDFLDRTYSLVASEETIGTGWHVHAPSDANYGWLDQDDPSIFIRNSVIANGLSLDHEYISDVVGDFVSGGNNLIGIDRVRRFIVDGSVTANQTSFVVESLSSLGLPETPFKLRISEANGLVERHEDVLVTSVSEDENEEQLTFNIARGQDGTTATDFASPLITLSSTGFWHPGDRRGSNDVVQRVETLLSGSLSSTSNELQVQSTSRVPAAPFSILVSHPGSDGLPDVEQMFVTEIEDDILKVHRGVMGTEALTHPDGAKILIDPGVAFRLDPLVGPSTDHGGPTQSVLPLPGSPLIDAGTEFGIRTGSARIVSNLGATTRIHTDLYMEVDSNAQFTALASSATVEDTVLKINDASVFPAAPFLIRIGDEFMHVTAVDVANQSITVDRGEFDSSVTEHDADSVIVHGDAITADSGATTLGVLDASTLPDVPFALQAGIELLRVTAIDLALNLIDVERGAYGTNSTSHTSGQSASSGYFLDADLFMAVQANDTSTTLDNIAYGRQQEVPLAGGATLLPGESIVNVSSVANLPSLPFAAQFKSHEGVPSEIIWVTGIDPDANRLQVERAVFQTTEGSYSATNDLLVILDSLAVQNTAHLPTAPLLLRVDDELMEATAIDQNVTGILVQRGAHDTLPISHDVGATVMHGTPVASDANQTLINVASVALFPPAPFVLRFGHEKIRVTAVDPAKNNITVERGVDGTLVESHDVRSQSAVGNFIEVANAAALPAAPFAARMGSEVALITSVDVNQNLLTAQRGAFKTDTSAHHAGSSLIFDLQPEAPLYATGYHGLPITLGVSVQGTSESQFTVNTSAELPTTSAFDLRIDQEDIHAESVDVSDGLQTLSVLRGVNSTTAEASHAATTTLVPLVDQRWSKRFVDSGFGGASDIDIGAVESIVFTVNSTSDLPDQTLGNGSIDTGTAEVVTLRAAIEEANALTSQGPDGVSATIFVPSGEFTLASDLVISGKITIVGIDAQSTILKGSQNRAFTLQPDASLSLRSLTIKDGSSQASGGAILVADGNLVADSIVISNSSAAVGGAIAITGGNVEVLNSSFVTNSSTTVGGAVAHLGGTLSITNSTFSANVAQQDGGGIYVDTDAELFSVNNTIANNTANAGGGIANEGTFHSANTLIATNIGNVSSPDISGHVTTLGGNLVGIHDFATISLQDSITSSDTVLQVSSTVDLPTTPFHLLLNNAEVVLVTDIDGFDGSLSVVRAQQGTAATSHQSGVSIRSDGIWHTADQFGSSSSALDPQLQPLQLSHNGAPLHELSSSSPAIDAGINASVKGFQTTLVYDISPANRELVVSTTTNFPRVPFAITVGTEEMTVVEVRNHALVVNRTPSLADAHNSGETITVLADQRHVYRTVDGDNDGTMTVDVGAFEVAPVLAISAVELTKLEGTSTTSPPTDFKFSVTRSGKTDNAVFVNYIVQKVNGETSINARDFPGGIVPSGIVHFAAGETSKEVTFTVVPDALVEADEPFQVQLFDPSPGVYLEVDSVDGTILADDAASLVVVHESIDEGTREEGSVVYVEVNLNAEVESHNGFEIAWHTTDGTANAGTDYTANSGKLEFVGDIDERQYIEVASAADTMVELDEEFNIAFDGITGIPPELAMWISLPTSAGTVTLVNDDAASLSIQSQKFVEGDTGQIVRTFDVQLSNDVDVPVQVDVATIAGTAAAGTDFVNSTHTLSFAGTAGEVKQVSISTYGDIDVEADEQFALDLTGLQASGREASIELLDATVEVLNDDDPSIIVTHVTMLEGDEDASIYVFNVILENPIGGQVTVDVSTADGTAVAGEDYVALSSSLTFDGNDGETLTFSVEVNNDAVVELDETFDVVLSNLNAGGAESAYTLVNGVGTIENDDQSQVNLANSWAREPGGDLGFVFFEATLTEAVDQPVNVTINTRELTASVGEDFESRTVNLQFAGLAGEVQRFGVRISQDDLDEDDETFLVTITDILPHDYDILKGTDAIGTIQGENTAALIHELCDLNDPPTGQTDSSSGGSPYGDSSSGGGGEGGYDGGSTNIFEPQPGPYYTDYNPYSDLEQQLPAPTGVIALPCADDMNPYNGPGSPFVYRCWIPQLPLYDYHNFGVTLVGFTGEILSDGSWHSWGPGQPDKVQFGNLILTTGIEIKAIDSNVFQWAWPSNSTVQHPDDPYGGTPHLDLDDLGSVCHISDNDGEEVEEDPVTSTATTTNTVDVDWTVPHTGLLTFNPFSTFNYRLAEDIGVTIGNDSNGFVRIGDSFDLEFGSVTVNADLTLTYDPFDDLMESGKLLPELDADGNVFRYTGIESFEAHIVDYAVVEPLTTPLGEGSPSSLPLTYASVPVELAVSNHLPSLRGDRIHSPENGRLYLDSPIFTDFETSYRIDVRDLFNDLDGEDDLDKLEIVNVTYSGRKLDEDDPDNNSATPPPASENEDPDQDPVEFRTPIGAIMTGGMPNPAVPGHWLGGTPNEVDLIVRKTSDLTLEIHNSVSQSNVGNSRWEENSYPSQLGLVVQVTDHSPDKSKPKLDENGDVVKINGEIQYEELIWEIYVDVRPRNQTDHQFNWRATTSAPETDFRPWISEVTPDLPTRYPNAIGPDNDPAVNPNTWRIVTPQFGPTLNSTDVGGVDVDVNAGEFRRYHDLILDGSGGTSELAIPGLVYDSSTIHVDGSSLPIVRIAVEGGGAITGSLKWHNQSGTVNATELYNDGHIFAYSPPTLDGGTGVYGWEFTASITSGTETVQLTTAGETPVIVGDETAIFGSGWGLEGVPWIWVDTRDESDTSAARRSFDDRIVLGFHGETPKIFNAMDLTFNDYSYGGTLSSLQPGSTEVSSDGFSNPQEFGKLTSRQNPDELVYDDGTGMEYVFKKYDFNGQVTYLIDRIEQPGIDFNLTTGDWDAGRRGLSFEWDDSTYSWPVLSVIEASDGARTLLDYTVGNGYLSSMTLVDNDNDPILDPPMTGDPVRQVFFKVENVIAGGVETRELLEIRHDNGSNDPVRVFEYDSGLMTLDQWYDDNPLDSNKLARHTEFSYTDGLLSEVQLGDDSPGENTIQYEVEPAVLASDFVGVVTIDVDDLAKYSETANAPVTTGGVYETFYKYSLDGLLERRTEYFDGLELSRESWDYDHIGSVKRYTDPLERQTFYWHDYERPLDYAANDEAGADDDTPKYDPDDYRGNITYLFTPAGQTIFEYETDDETNNAVGTLVKQIDKPKVSATGQPAPGGTVNEVVTVYDRREDGRVNSLRTIRGMDDNVVAALAALPGPAGAALAAVDPKDYTESWSYANGLLQTHTNPLGLVTEYKYETDSSRIEIINVIDEGVDLSDSSDDEVTSTKFEYDDRGFIEKQTSYTDVDATGDVISVESYQYNPLGLTTAIEIEDGGGTLLSREQYEYAPDGTTTAVGNGNDVYSSFTYDKAGLLTEETVGLVKDASGDFVSAEYYSFYASSDVPVSETTSYEYYDDGSLKAAVLPGNIHQSNYADPTEGKYWSATDGVVASPHTNALQVVRTEVDAIGRTTLQENLLLGTSSELLYEDARIDLPTKTTERVNLGELDASDNYIIADVWSEYRYDANGNVLQEAGHGSAGYTTKYDELGNPIETAVKPTNNIGPGSFVTHSYVTNPLGAVLEQTEFRKTPSGASWNTEPFVTTYIYDQQSRLREVIDPLTDGVGSCTATVATPQTDECNATPAKTSYEFDGGDLKVTSVSRTGATSLQWINGIGQLVKERGAWGVSETDLTKAVTTYEYDLVGNLTKQKYTPATNETAIQATETEIKYDALNRPRVTISHGTQPLFAATDYFAPGDANSDGWNVVSFVPFAGTDPTTVSVPNIKDLATKTKFDSLGKSILVEAPDPGEVDHDNDPATPAISSDHGTSQTEIKYTYEPDTLTYTVITEQVAARKDGAVAKDLVTVNTFNSRGQLIQGKASSLGTLPNTRRTTQENEYHPTGQIKQSVDGEDNITLYLDLDQVSGQPLQIQRGEIDPTTGDIDNSKLRVTSHYKFDSAGNMTHEVHPAQLNNPVRRTYDALGRLIRERVNVDQRSLNGSSGSVDASRTWKYSGNSVVYKNRNNEYITTTTDLSARTTTEVWYAASTSVPSSSIPPLTTIVSSFTSDGRPESDGSISFNYDDQGRLTQTTQNGSSLPDIQIDTTYGLFGRNETEVRLDGTLVQRETLGIDRLGRVATQIQDFASSANATWNNGSVASDKVIHTIFNSDSSVQQIDRFIGTAIGTTPTAGYTQFGYNDEADLDNLYHRKSDGTSLAQYELIYHDDGRLKTRTQKLYLGATTAESNIVQNYEYDSSGRLIEIDVDGVSNPRPVDEAGNQGTDLAGLNRLVSDAAYEYRYDLEGRLVERTAKSGNAAAVANTTNTVTYSNTLLIFDAWTEDGSQHISPDDGDHYAEFDFSLPGAGDFDLYLNWEALSDGGHGKVEIRLAGATDPFYTTTIDFSQPDEGEKLGRVHVDSAVTLEVRIDQAGFNDGKLAFGSFYARKPYQTTTYDWDHRNRLSEETIIDETGAGLRIEYEHDPLNRIVGRKETILDTSGNDVSYEWSGYVYDGSRLVYELTEEFDASLNRTVEITRSWFTSLTTGQAVATDETLDGGTSAVWVFSDMSGTARSLVTIDSSNNLNILHRDFSADGRADTLDQKHIGDVTNVALADAPIIWNGLQFDVSGAFYTVSGGAYDPISARSMTDRGGSNGYVMFGGAPTNAQIDWEKLGGEFAHYGEGLIHSALSNTIGNEALAGASDGAITAGVLAVSIPTALIAAPFVVSYGSLYVAGGLSAAYLGTGATAGAYNGVAQTYAGNHDASWGELGLNGAAGAFFGGPNPVGEGVTAIGGIVGGAIDKYRGNDFFGTGYLAGSLVGAVATGGVDDYARVTAKGAKRAQALRHAALFTAVEGGITVGAGAYGRYQTGSWDGALGYAYMGNLGGGLAASRFVKCFVAGTSVLVPVDAEQVDYATVAMAGILPPNPSRTTSNTWWQVPVGLGLFAAGAAGWSWGQAKRDEKKKVDAKNATESVFGDDEMEDWLADTLRPVEPLWKAKKRPLNRLAFG